MERVDIAVIGAGFGGLAAALTAADGGAKVALLEQLRYPGGCASTFTRGGARYEAGATLFSGFAPGQLFERWIRRYRLPVRFERLDPVIELRAPSFTLPIPPDRERFLRAFTQFPSAPAAKIRSFFGEQEETASVLWSLFDDPALLPPLTPSSLLRHLARAPRYLPLLRHFGRPLTAMLERHGLASFLPLRLYLDAVCQITVQASAEEVESPFALAAMDYCFRGTGHVHGGIGELAWALLRAAEERGALVRTSDRVKGLKRTRGSWRIEARRGPIRADRVIANLTPHALRRLLELPEGAHAELDRRSARVEEGWGAAMLYLLLRPGAKLRPGAHHIELILDERAPLIEGNHLFVSVSAESEQRSESGGRTVTVSTHLPMKALRAHPDPGAYVGRVQERMREGLKARAPAIWSAVERELSGSPRTFERFTGRDHGYVGGVPRRAGLSHYLEALRGGAGAAIEEGLYLVGDSVFPGQSTLACALGGARLAESLLR